ncbi:MAG TPA: arylsulfatase [Planctomycetaceae bacterium]|nr:arylsulfatase [Planctomycetaceae bacterium]
MSIRLALLLALLFASSQNATTHAQQSQRPNIIYIMGDDMGYSDLGCYGGEIDTPNLDGLAAGGVRLSSFYNMARCCPTRASLLTGLYPHQAGIGWMMSDSGFDGYRGELNRNCVTIAEVLRGAGYKTFMSGKWHVTSKTTPENETGKANWPLQRGFDRFYGTIHGAGSFWDPFSLTRDNMPISPVADELYQPAEGFYYTDAISDHAVRFVNDHADTSENDPFFMYVSYTAAHWPMHARERDIAKYSGTYDDGYEATRQRRFERLLASGLVTADQVTLWKMQDAWKETEHWDWDKRNMEVYAAMVDSMDQGIGRIVAALKETGQLENTFIAFLQDNGGCAEAYGRRGDGKPRADAPTLEPLADDYLQPDMQPKQTRDGYPVRTGKGVMAGPADTYIGYGKGWATVSNTPFREYKHWTHEGGISSPLIVHWPRGLAGKLSNLSQHEWGAVSHTPAHLIDLMATAVDLASADYPNTFHDGNAITPMEGTSLLPAITTGSLPERALFWEHEGNRAVRLGEFKLVAKGREAPWELYNMAQDRSEQTDIASQHPDIVAQLSRQWLEYAQRANVLPLTPYYDKKKKKK